MDLRTLSRRSLLLASLAMACQTGSEAPPVAGAREVPVPQVEVLPAPPPPPRAISRPTDIGECLPGSFRYPEIPVVVTVSYAGRAMRVDFYSMCTGEDYDVPKTVANCILGKLSRWEWMTIHDGKLKDASTSPYGTDQLVALRPQPRGGGSSPQSSGNLPFTSFGCVG